MLHRAEARGAGREAFGHGRVFGGADRCAVTLQNILPLFVGCKNREQVTMPRLRIIVNAKRKMWRALLADTYPCRGAASLRPSLPDVLNWISTERWEPKKRSANCSQASSISISTLELKLTTRNCLTRLEDLAPRPHAGGSNRATWPCLPRSSRA